MLQRLTTTEIQLIEAVYIVIDCVTTVPHSHESLNCSVEQLQFNSLRFVGSETRSDNVNDSTKYIHRLTPYMQLNSNTE
jgi:hypothetical protein